MAHRILLVDHSRETLDAMGSVLSRARHQVARAQTARDALRLAGEFKPDVALIDLELPDTPGPELIRILRQTHDGLSCVLITRFGHEESDAEALRQGASDCLRQPVTRSLLLAAVESAAGSKGCNGTDHAALHAECHSVTRWADVVVRSLAAPRDFRTLPEFGRAVGVSSGGFRNWCRTAHLSPRQSLKFARVFRAVIRQSTTPAPPEDLLNVVDRRTLAKLLVASGGTPTRLPGNEHEFLERQRFIENQAALAAVQAALVSLRNP